MLNKIIETCIVSGFADRETGAGDMVRETVQGAGDMARETVDNPWLCDCDTYMITNIIPSLFIIFCHFTICETIFKPLT